MIDLTPPAFHLGQNFPNPFCDSTRIKFCVAYGTHVTIDVLNCGTGAMTRITDGKREAGTYEVEFDGRDLSEGDYLCIFHAGDHVQVKTMTVRR